MVNRKYVQSIIIIIAILGIVSIVMAAPTVNIIKPTASESIFGTYTLRANVTPTANITSVQFLYKNTSNWILIGNGLPNGADYTYNWNTVPLANGSYNLNVTAKDNTGNETSNTAIIFLIANTINNPPSVTVIYPNGGETVNGTITLNATASDSDGTIANVTFYYSNDGTTWNLIGIQSGSAGNSYTRNWVTSSLNGTGYSIKAKVFDNLESTAEDTSNSVFSILNDITPPKQVTSLSASAIGKNYINWTWSDPEDSDFSSVNVSLNTTATGTNVFSVNVPKGIKYFNSSNLNPDTEYKLSTMTVDISGNKNITSVYNISTTLPNTEAGTNIIIDLDGVKVSFSNVTASGNTSKKTYTVSDNGSLFDITGPAFNITTTAIFDSAIVEMSHSSANPNKVKLYHYENSIWKDITKGSSSNKVWGNVTNLSPFVPGDPSIPKKLSIYPLDSPFSPIGSDAVNFAITFNEAVNVTWLKNGTQLPGGNNTSVTSANYLLGTQPVGTWNITASWENTNGSDSYSWILKVRPTTYFTGNRIWDGSKPDDFALTYTWNPMSFSGFYYNAKDDVGNENITITMGGYTNSYRTINEGKLIYRTSPQEVSFAASNLGKYQVIGFMADNYFAGYTINTNYNNTRPTTDFVGKSAVSQGQLHKVLIDEDVKRTISVGGTLALKEGYVLKATDIDLNARQMLISLLKDGNEVDVSPLSAGQTYVYSKTVGGVESLPLIMVRFDSVFSGQELQVAFMKGMFQISEDATMVKMGNNFRNMEVSNVNAGLIEMKNSANIPLNKGSTVDVMGDVKIKVADNDSVVRFALTVEKTGNFEVRSTVYKNGAPLVWTPYNFGMNIGKTSIGFYYDLDDGIGSEKLTLDPGVTSSIPDKSLKYSTSPSEVKFTYTGFGKYQVIGFMADKYFAGYTSNTGVSGSGNIVTRPSTDFNSKSTLANGALHKVLIDDDTKRTISVGSTIALQEGYVIKATDIDLKGRQMLISLLKDGTEVDVSPLSAGETYVYTKTVGGTESLPLIMIRFDNVFSGQELQVAFLKGMFQISENPTTIKAADQFGKMEVRSVSKDIIEMSNDGSIGLSKNTNNVLMGNLKLKVADNDTLPFYFAVDVTADMIANQLVISAPTKVMAGDTVKIKITAGTVAVDNSSLTLDTDMGMTDKNGELNYTIPKTLKAGNYTITATKTGYEKATKSIDIEKYVDYRLGIEMPTKANQYETITIKVLYNGSAMSGAAVMFDNTSIGTTNSNGEVSYRLETSGTHSITASKTSYIAVSRDVDIRAPYSEFKALDINVTPNPVFAGEDFMIKSNITNVGTKSDTLPVDLIINGSVVDNRTITIGPNEKVEINFTRQEPLVTNVTVDIMGQNVLLQVQEKPTNYLLIAAIATGIGAVIIYVLTSKGLLSLELLKQKFGMLSDKLSTIFKK